MISIKTPRELGIMAEGGRILARIVDLLAKQVKPGITTKALDKVAEDLVLQSGAKPAFKGYQGFPATLCTAVNDEVVHAVPSKRVLQAGDILSLDCGVLYKGFYTDMAITVPVGAIRESETMRLIKVAKKALKRGIKKVRPGNTFGDIGNTIQRYIEGQGFGVVRDLAGHGIGKELHEEPHVYNYGKRHTGDKLQEGMTFCIEPMVTMGDWHLQAEKDGHGFTTKDNSLSAHCEHTIAVTKEGCKILTELE